METYKSEEVIELLDARIHPTDNTVPECKCYIRLTANHVFISEDNFDGTYDDHYILDIAQIDEIKISEPYKTSIGYTSTSLDKNAGKKPADQKGDVSGNCFPAGNAMGLCIRIRKRLRGSSLRSYIGKTTRKRSICTLTSAAALRLNLSMHLPD